MSKFISFEGIDGSGKTTQASRLCNFLTDLGQKARLTREPGGSFAGERIRSIILTEELDDITNFFLFNAARSDHCRSIVKPLLDEGFWVICDRFFDSTDVYQSNIDYSIRKMCQKMAVPAGCFPSKTFVIDIPGSVAVERLQARQGKLTSFDAKSEKEHEANRQKFLRLHNGDGRLVFIDGTGTEQEVFRKIFDNLPNIAISKGK